MRLATLKDGSRDGTLVAVSEDGGRVAWVPGYATLQSALDDWDRAQVALRAAAQAAETGEVALPAQFAAPLPRAWQWLDGSAFPHHGELMQRAFNHAPIETALPLMYQGMSHRFIGPTDDVPLPSEADGIDFEGEFGIVTGEVPMGCAAEDALAHVRLVLLINDWSLRALAVPEMKTGFGWVQAKPACSVAPFAVTPDALGADWRDGRVAMDLLVDWNGARFGAANGVEMQWSFPELVAHAARTRDLVAGTIIGSGTVSNANYAEVGSSCISERRAIEIIASGAPTTRFMADGDTIRMEARGHTGDAPFGVIEQRVVVRPQTL